MFRSARKFSAAVRGKRKGFGWTWAELAARAGTGERFIVELESGQPNCQLEKALIVARAVGIGIGGLRTVQWARLCMTMTSAFCRPSVRVDDNYFP